MVKLSKDIHNTFIKKCMKIIILTSSRTIFSDLNRSELVIEHTGAGDNGTYYCQAENKAARSVSNFTLHVTDRDFNPDGPTILQVNYVSSLT
jgi:hypothetical protein